MNAKKMIAAFAVLAMAFAAFAFVPAVQDDAVDKEIVYMNGDVTSTLTGTTEQLIIIDKNMTVKSTGSITVNGDLIVKDGVTVTIEGGFFNIYGSATINGDIVSKVTNGLSIRPGEGCSAVVNGTVTALGDASGTMDARAVHMFANPAIPGYGEIIVNGTVTIGTNSSAYISQSVLFAENSKLVVLGEISGYIYLAGYVYFDGSVSDNAYFGIYFANAKGVVDIISVMCEDTDEDDDCGHLYVADSSMYAYTYGGEEYYVNSAPYYASDENECAIDEDFQPITYNMIYIDNATNLKVTEKVTTSIKYNESDSKNYMVAATEMIVSALDSSKNVETVDGRLGCISVQHGCTNYLESMTIADVAVSVGDGDGSYDVTLTIAGNVTFLLSDLRDDQGKLTQIFTVDRASTLVVDGLLLIKKDDIKASSYTIGTVIAAHYTVKNADNSIDNYYATLQKAIDNGATIINMMGQLVVEKDLTVPAGVKLETAEVAYSSPIDDEDYSVIVKEGATFTIANGAKFVTPATNGNMKIEGAFVIENIDYGITLGTTNGVWADVMVQDGQYVKYMNVYIAFNEAKAGDELKAFNPVDGKVKLGKDITLPAGVLFDNNGKIIYVEKLVTFTVAGKLFIDDYDTKLVAETAFKDSVTKAVSGAVAEYSVIAIGPNGLVTFKDVNTPRLETQTIYNKFEIAGAYFQNDPATPTEDGELYIADAVFALNGISDALGKKVDLYGKLTIENIKVTGTEKDRIAVNIDSAAEITMKGFTFAYGTVYVEVDATLYGDIGTATGKMIFDEAKVIATSTCLTEKFLNDAMNLAVSGGFKSENSTSVSGIVFISDFEYIGEAELDSGFAKIDDSKFIVPAGSQLFVFGETANDKMTVEKAEFIIEGTVIVKNSGKLTAYLVSVLGTLTVEKIDGKSGVATVDRFIVGGTTDSFKGVDVGEITGAASINGAGSFAGLDDARVLVFNGADVSADVMADWMAADTTQSTQFYVEGSIWMTAYAGKDATLLIYNNSTDNYNFEPAIDNVKFCSWQTYDEKTKTYTDVDLADLDVPVGSAGFEKVYANIETAVYTVNVNADQGIDNVYIDGVLMIKTVATNSYTADVAAGTHALSYTLANGYSGNAVITTIDGAKLVGGGLSFVANDDKSGDDRTLDITLSGVVKSGYDTDPETHTEASNGLSVTEILLIVVVIIMAVMAVVLILRLNRS